ncbi:hypothetical protein EV356DRAFT_484644 [Viridothelium virens]|uniref:Aminoglycoside phosphotransferase domain-containing protein n=1 Tax=Viridothelium virens TaxID=1048519 RepID=A0A6A6H9H1_VIRVR|nr:hypothetical protein EV356DRAFT_484644 [Viridothelium virens]
MHLPPLTISPLPIVKMSQGSSRSAHLLSPPVTPELDYISKLVLQHGRGANVHRVERLSGHLHRIYLLRMTDGSRLVLKMAPSTNVRLLRMERQALNAEATTLELLASRLRMPVPTLIKFDPHDRSLGTSYSLQTCPGGVNMSNIGRLSTSERANIDRSLGTYFRHVSSLAAARFGPPHLVFNGSGCDTWRESFFQMLEMTLRDGEDVLVNLPYDSIRYYTQRHGHLLDQVTEARLVLLGITNEHNVLLDERTRYVTGLLGLSDAVLGDPFMATAFVNPSAAFLQGYGTSPSRTSSEAVRQLLYRVYRAVVAVVKHYYRPRSDGMELQARRELTDALRQLATT